MPAVDAMSSAQSKRPTPTAALAVMDGTKSGRPFTDGTVTLSRGKGASAITKCHTPSAPNIALTTIATTAVRPNLLRTRV